MANQSLIDKNQCDFLQHTLCSFTQIAREQILKDSYLLGEGYCREDYFLLVNLTEILLEDQLLDCEDYDFVKEELEKIQRKYPKECFVKQTDNTSTLPPEEVCLAPTVTNIVKEYTEKFNLDVRTFENVFIDPEEFEPELIKIVSVPDKGVFLSNNTEIIAGQEIPFTEIRNISFEFPGELQQQSTTFIFQIKHNNTKCNLFSNMATFTINSAVYINQPPSAVGDNTINVPNRSTTTLTLAMFTTDTTPVYADPENDPVDAVRIDTLSLDGQLQLNGVNVTANQIIPVADINNNQLTFIAPDQDPADQDVFTFSLRDSGSGQFAS